MRIPELGRGQVLVVGDVMLDRYWFGEVDRISPEAPVPVVRIERSEERPGGAANVARNIASVGGRAALLSVVGDDEAANTLGGLMQRAGVAASLHRDASISTTVKLRVVARHQQLLRIDFETPPSREVLADKLIEFDDMLKNCDVVVLSDYGKGGLTHITHMIEQARAAGKPVLVDPKGSDYSRYHGATLITPNRSELKAVIGAWTDEFDLTSRVMNLRESLGLEAILLTRSEEGMTLYREGTPLNEPATAREIFDVSGAGDTVIAVLAAMMAAGSNLENSMRVANLAAGIVVGKLGTAAAEIDELLDAVARIESRKI